MISLSLSLYLSFHNMYTHAHAHIYLKMVIFFVGSFFLCYVLMIFRPPLSPLFGVMKGREDDNVETIRKRFKVFLESSLPVVEYYDSKGKVRKVVYLFMHLFV